VTSAARLITSQREVGVKEERLPQRNQFSRLITRKTAITEHRAGQPDQQDLSYHYSLPSAQRITVDFFDGTAYIIIETSDKISIQITCLSAPSICSQLA